MVIDSSPIARHFAALLARLGPDDPPLVRELGARLVMAGEGGDVCLDLREQPEPAHELRQALQQSAVVGAPGDWQPLILDADDRLYLYRQWLAEQSLAGELRRRAGDPVELDAPLLAAGIARLFPAASDSEQAQAAQTALQRRFCVISGGPGTGKTTTVVKVLALLLEQYGVQLRIAVTAPTGKAAGRLRESIAAARDTLACSTEIRAAIPGETRTLHRLLGAGREPGSFRHGRDNPLALDVLVLDEASMVDLTLMSRLLAALPATARLILLGDRDQLASVEAGAVLADLCAGADGSAADNPLAGAIVTLQQSRRFAADSTIGALCRAVNAGHGEEALALLRQEEAAVHWRELPPPEELIAALGATVADAYAVWLKDDEPATVLDKMNRCMVLCALRQGPYGVAALNQSLERLLARRGLIQPQSEWYRGRPLLITRNAPELGLFNGDLGVILPDPADGTLKAFFAASDGTLRSVAPLLLPAHETAFALTVHKSQGSEFGRVLLVLPGQASEVLSRELVYTGVSRARQSLTVWGREEAFLAGVARRVTRRSGLRARLWGDGG